MTVGKCMLLVLLAALTREDIRRKQISIKPLIPAGIAGIALFFAGRPFSAQSLLGGIGVGVFLLIVSAVGRGGVGAGDGWALLVAGIFLGFGRTLALLMTALFLAAGYALLLLAVKRCGRKQEFAFLPFVLAAYLCQLWG